MNIEQPLRQLFGVPAKPGLVALPLGPGHWHILFAGGERPLLLPVGDIRLQQRSLSYFVPAGWKSLYGRTLLLMNSVAPAARLLPECRLPEGTLGFLSGRLPFSQPSHSAIQIGRAGPNQKAAMLLLTERGDGLALAKISMLPAADPQVTVEARWLSELAAVPELENRVPRLLTEGLALTNRRYLVTTIAPATGTTKAFTPAHAAFLGALGRAGSDVMSFTASPCFQHLEKTLARLEPQLTRHERAVLQAVLRECRLHLAGWTGPFVTAHGDFVPWNIRVHADEIFVFDWEHARRGANPLADALNYFVMQRAVYARAIGSRFLVATMRRVEALARQLYPEWTWRAGVVSALGLAYLLQVLLDYSVAGRTLARAHPVVAGYMGLMEERSAWMAV